MYRYMRIPVVKHLWSPGLTATLEWVSLLQSLAINLCLLSVAWNFDDGLAFESARGLSRYGAGSPSNGSGIGNTNSYAVLPDFFPAGVTVRDVRGWARAMALGRQRAGQFPSQGGKTFQI